jgi:hypothetical protein
MSATALTSYGGKSGSGEIGEGEIGEGEIGEGQIGVSSFFVVIGRAKNERSAITEAAFPGRRSQTGVWERELTRVAICHLRSRGMNVDAAQ